MSVSIYGRVVRVACVLTLVAMAACLAAPPATQPAADEEGFVAIFDGKTLDGWDGNPKFWSVQDGTITGQTTKENPTKGNTFIVWRKGEPGDFDLRLDFRMAGGNSGVQYRSWEEPDKWGKWVIGGYQADMDAGNAYTGIIYGERFRGFLAHRGKKCEVGDDHKLKVVETFADGNDLKKVIKADDWNQYRIVAQGNHMTQYINGHKMSELVDNDTKTRRAKGLLALQLHAGPPMKVQFRNIRIKELKAEAEK